MKLIFILIKDEKPLLFFSIFSFLFLFLSLFIGIPIIHEFYLTGLVNRLPVSCFGWFINGNFFLIFFGGLILDVIKKIRYENKRINFYYIKIRLLYWNRDFFYVFILTNILTNLFLFSFLLTISFALPMNVHA